MISSFPRVPRTKRSTKKIKEMQSLIELYQEQVHGRKFF